MSPARTSACVNRLIGTAEAFQMSAQYSRIERSDENLPERAVFRIDMRV